MTHIHMQNFPVKMKVIGKLIVATVYTVYINMKVESLAI